jgi:RimJ/RimL family protein N-acetyltransferase/ABC-type transporter Mla MlaB component
MSASANTTRVKYDGALVCTTAPGFCQAVWRALRKDQVRALEIDVERVKQADAVGLAALWQAVRHARGRGIAATVLPSAAVYRALLQAELLDEVTLAGPRAGELDLSDYGEPNLGEAALTPVAESGRVVLRPPSWDELGLFTQWANESLLDQMVGSPLLYQCRHTGPYHPDFVARVLHDPTALTLLIQTTTQPGASPVGFVRLHGIHLVERFAFVETALGDATALRKGLGVEASRLALAYAMDTLELHRVEAKVYAYNVLSINALRQNGFELEGTLREARTYDGRRWDVLVFSILDPEMRAQRAQDRFPGMRLWPADARS